VDRLNDTLLRASSDEILMNSRSWNDASLSLLVRCRGAYLRRIEMKVTIIALSAAALIAAGPAVFAQGVSSKTPGHEMQAKGSKKGHPGASGYAPGQEMQAKGSKKGSPGASGYAPGHTSGSNAKRSY
jgi:hypothetical protein